MDLEKMAGMADKKTVDDSPRYFCKYCGEEKAVWNTVDRAVKCPCGARGRIMINEDEAVFEWEQVNKA